MRVWSLRSIRVSGSGMRRLSCPYATADLSPLFNWNTKQLFLYLDAEYTNAKGVRGRVHTGSG